MSKEVTIEMVNAFLTFHTHEWETFKSSCIEKHKAGSPSGRDFEILEGIHEQGGKVHKWFPDNTHGGLSCEEQGCSIHSVRRNSDSQIFTVGDVVGAKHKANVTIKLFNIVKEKMMVECGDDYCDLYWLTKVASPTAREPLFVTFDGVSIYDGDSYYRILDTFEVQGNYNVTKKPSDATIKHSFGKLEAAKDYVLMNKPCLSIKEIISIRLPGSLIETKIDKFFAVSKKRLEHIVQQKINPL